MNYKLKKAAATVCMGACVFSFAPGVSMADAVAISEDQTVYSEISPRMQYISAIDTTLSISGTTATVISSVEGYANRATKSQLIVELQLKTGPDSWLPVGLWSDSDNDYRTSITETCTVTAGNTYRIKATATVWEGDNSETHTYYGGEKTA